MLPPVYVYVAKKNDRNRSFILNFQSNPNDLLAPLKQKYNTTQLTHRTVMVLIGQVIEESHALNTANEK